MNNGLVITKTAYTTLQHLRWYNLCHYIAISETDLRLCLYYVLTQPYIPVLLHRASAIFGMAAHSLRCINSNAAGKA